MTSMTDAAPWGVGTTCDSPITDGGERASFRPSPGRSDMSLRRHLVLGDIVAVVVAWCTPLLTHSRITVDREIAASVAAVVATLAVLQMVGLYRSWVCSDFSRQTLRAALAAGAGAVVLVGSNWLAGTVSVPPALEGAASAAALIVLMRWRFTRWLRHKRAEGDFLRTVVLVGTNEDANAIAQMLDDEPALGYRVGAVVGNQHGASWRGIPSRSTIADLPVLAQSVGAEGIILVCSAVTAGDASAAIDASLANGLHVQVWPGLAGLLSRRIRTAPVSGLPMLYVEPHRAPSWQVVTKRAIDIVVAALFIPLTAPIMLVAAMCVRIEDGGPVLYRHSVIGRYGLPTKVLKLRTMVPDAHEMLEGIASLNERKGGPLFKASNDPRVTRTGRILRATSIDELPQLWDVLTGRMSLVGPRFALEREVAQFDEDLKRRTAVRPGITGLWQTEARDNPSFSAYRRLDLLYVDNWSLGMDLAILANTVHAVTVRAFRALHLKRVRPARVVDLAAREAGFGDNPGADLC